MKYVVFPLEVYWPMRRPKISYRVVNLDAGLNERKYPKETVAWSDNESVAQRIADMMNGAGDSGWQACLDFANRKTAEAVRERDEARKEINRLRELATKQLAERIQVGEDYRHLLNRANTQRDNAEAALAAVRRIVNKTTDVN